MALDALTGRIEERGLEQEMRSSYLDYAMSVIVGRALPDVRDGLKPVHRRVLYAMHDIGLQPTRAYRKCAFIVGEVMGKYHPHGDSAIYDTLGADGAGLLAALHAGRRPGQLRLDRRRPGRRDEVHRGAPRPAGDRDAARHRRRHRRLRPQLRRIDPGAAGPAVALPEPAGQRHLGDRGRDGDQHPAAQPARGRRRGHRLHRRPRDRPRRADGAHQGPRLPRRRHDEPRGDPRRLRLRPRQHQGPRPRPRRAAEGGQGGDRRHRAAVHGQEGRRRRPDHEDRRPRPRQETRGHLRPPRRERRTLRDAAGDRAQTRRAAGQSRPQQPLQKNRDAVDLRRQHGGAGRRRAADAEPAAS